MTTKFERLLAVVLTTGMAAALSAGCGATDLADRSRSADVRMSIPMRADSPRLVVAGPARLLHIDVQGHSIVSLYSVKQQTGLESDCNGEPLPAAKTLVPDESNQLNLDVPAGEAVCMINVNRDGTRHAQVHLHARRPTAVAGSKSGVTGVLQARND